MTVSRILMCDDEPEVGAFVRHIAEELGYEMHFTNRAGEFGPLYRSCRPDIVILDLAMPGTDGIELIRFLAKERSQARILLMSGFEPEMRELAQRLGEAHELDMVGIVPKPVRAATLRKHLAGLGSRSGSPAG